MRTSRDLTAVGVTCGIGSMLVGARAAGFKVLGNLEWRDYYRERDGDGRNTFEANFPGALLRESIDDLEHSEIERLMGATLALGHPECGNFSQLSGVNRNRLERMNDPGDIPLFVDLVAQLQPEFFVMDDLPKSFGCFPVSEYVRRLPDYDLFPEWVSNWGYGNVQRHRNRMFMIGSRRRHRWAFRPGEVVQHGLTLASVIGDLSAPSARSNIPNHYPPELDLPAAKSLSMAYLGQRPTWRELSEYARTHWRPGQSMTYHANDGTMKYKPGCKIEHWDERGASVQDGGSYKLHPLRFDSLTLRERARIQGFPDDFVFYGARLNDRGEYNPDKNIHMCKQTGKAMPVQFCEYVSRQVAAAVRGEEFSSSGQRILKPNDDVNRAKQWYCENVGYADQSRACGECWLYAACTIRMRKYRVGEPLVGQRDLIDPGTIPVPEQSRRRRPVPRRRQEERPHARPRSVSSPGRTAGSTPATGARFKDLDRSRQYVMTFERRDDDGDGGTRPHGSRSETG